MARVSAVEGISYGVGMFGYMLGVVVFGFLLFAVGIGLLVSEQYVIGLVLFLLGGIATYAGMVGTTYKVIADAVHKGTQDLAATPTAQKVGGGKATAEKVSDEASVSTARKVPDDDSDAAAETGS